MGWGSWGKVIIPLVSPGRKLCGKPVSHQTQKRLVPAAAQHSRLDLQRSLLDQDGQGREDTQSLTDGGEEERPALQSGLPGVGVGTGLGGSAEGPHCRAHGTRGRGCCPLPHCLPRARSPAESRQILQTCPLRPLPISLCPSPLRSLSFSQQPLTQVLPQCVSVSHLHPGPICQDSSPLPPPAFLPGASGGQQGAHGRE